MAIPIINAWEKFFDNPHEGLGSSYERIVLNDLLLATAAKYDAQSVLESPSFGFTGISGINLVALADAGLEVTLEDDNTHRLELIRNLWRTLDRSFTARHNPGFKRLDYPDQAFDLSVSFSALWFVPDLNSFLRELSRVTSKAIFISVPNRAGLGYKMQLKDYSAAKYPDLRLDNIDPPSIIRLLKALGWKLAESGCFDCPPWPDIGMTKEELLAKWLPQWLLPKKLARPKQDDGEAISILSHYLGDDPGFDERMRAYQWLEKAAPEALKRVWAHHFRMVFER